MQKKLILNESLDTLADYCVSAGFKKFSAAQVLRWLYFYREPDFHKMTDISKTLREKLDDDFHFLLPEIVNTATETDDEGKSVKYLLKLADGEVVESVLIGYENRQTLCVSSQAGCRMGCLYCETAGLGFSRNLTSGEIISQVLTVEKYSGKKITNVVFMGMGEPLDNLLEVKKAIHILSNDNFIGIAPRKITVSTCGLFEGLQDIEKYKCKIAISLNAGDNKTRTGLMPVNKKFPLEKIAEYVNSRKPSRHNKITLEYVLIKGINDGLETAKNLTRLFSPSKAKFNLIPLNKDKNSIYLKDLEKPEEDTLNYFREKLLKAGFIVTVRLSKGQSISGGCGQLKSKTIRSL